MSQKHVSGWIITLTMLCVLCFSTRGYAEQYPIYSTDGRWNKTCDLEAPEDFRNELYQYQYVQQKADTTRIQSLFTALYDASLAFKPDRENPSHIYLGDALMISIPTFVSQPTEPTEPEYHVIAQLEQGLSEAGFHPYKQPYLCASLNTLLQETNEGIMGRTFDWTRYLASICNESTAILPEIDDLVVVFVPEIDGYPVTPQLLGHYTETAVPMYAYALIRQDTVLYMDIGCAYEITKERRIETELVSWQSAVDTAMAYAENQWRQGFEAMATVRTENLDYPGFFAAYQPLFSLEAKRVTSCYYGSGGILRPAYQIDVALTITLENDEELTAQGRHSYLPEVLRYTYIVDAMTGDVVK